VPDSVYDPEAEEQLGRAFDRRLAARLMEAARPHRGLIAGSLALFPLIAVVELAQPWLLKVAIDDHILKSDWVGLTWIGGLYIAVLAILYALRTLEAYLMQLTGQRVIHDLRETIFDHLLRLEARFFDRNPVGRLMTRVLHDVDAVSDAFTSGLFAVVADVITLTGVVAVMLWIDWRLALVTFSMMPIFVVVAVYFRLNARDAYRQVRRRLARLNGFLQESLQGMTVVQLFVREGHERERFHRLNSDYRRALFRSTRWESSLYAVVEALGSIALALLIWYGGGRIIAESLTFGALVAFIQYTNRFFLPIRDLGAKYTVMQWAMASSERIFGLLDRAPAIVSPAAPRPRPARAPGTPAVELDSVWFAYEGEQWVLRDCSFSVAPGERVAIVGATGEGKTTCARLLNRSYDVRQGRVLVDGVDVREWDLASLRRHVGIIFQDSVLFAGTIEDNLRLGADGAVSPADLTRALDTAHAGFVSALPRGLGETLGERGANVSHGQRQLLAIARALVYNPAVLVLDEAMSSVDPESEALIRQAMTGLLAGRTSITIAHRLSTIHAADRILVVHHGRIHEDGTHAELLRRGGLYARLHELQTGAASG
jgi:ATP-binding cassette subfamily B protein